ncbi:hypothetical protein ACKAV7_013095 [Fusarium commune]
MIHHAHSDSLKRHMQTHGPEAARLFSGQISSHNGRRTAQACGGCVRSKQRCGGGKPCQRCQRKGTECVYSAPEMTAASADKRAATSAQQFPPSSVSLGQPAQSAIEEMVENGEDRIADSEASMADFYNSSTDSALFDIRTNVSHPQDSVMMESTWGYNLHSTVDNAMSSGYLDSDFALDGFASSFLHPMVPWITEWPQRRDWMINPGEQNDIQSLLLREQNSESQNLPVSPNCETGAANLPRMSKDGAEDREDIDPTHVSISFPTLEPGDLGKATADSFGHTSRISDGAYRQMRQAYERQHRRDTHTSSRDEASFPHPDLLHSFVELYFEYFHPNMPIIHVATFEPSPDVWVLLLGMAALGSRYSKIRNSEEFAVALQRLLQRQIPLMVSSRFNILTDLRFTQAVLLLHNCLLFSGSKQGVLELQYQRNLLITLLRPMIAGHGSIFRSPQPPSEGDTTQWRTWIMRESWGRLVYYAWLFECFQLVFLDLPPLLNVYELRLSLPASEALWECPHAASWEGLAAQEKAGLRTMKKTRSHFPAAAPKLVDLFCPALLPEDTFSTLGDAGRLITLVSLHAEEHRLSQLFSSWLYFPKFRHRDDQEPAINQSAQSRQPANSPRSPFFDRVFALLDPKFEPSHGSGALEATNWRVYRTISILRVVPLRTLFILAGWKTTTQEIDIARNQLEECLNGSPRPREALLHAANLLELIRSQTVGSYIDPWCLTVASMYIWAYSRVAMNCLQDVESTEYRKRKTLRLDRPLDPETRQIWLEGLPVFRLHITGIGFLEGSDSGSRTLKEAVRIMRRSTTWRTLNSVLAFPLEQLCHGLSPLVPE